MPDPGDQPPSDEAEPELEHARFLMDATRELVSSFDGVVIPDSVLSDTRRRLEMGRTISTLLSLDSSLYVDDEPDGLSEEELEANAERKIQEESLRLGGILAERVARPSMKLGWRENDTFIDDMTAPVVGKRNRWEPPHNTWEGWRGFKPYEHPGLSSVAARLSVDPKALTSVMGFNVAVRPQAVSGSIQNLIKLREITSRVTSFPYDRLGLENPFVYQLDNGGTGLHIARHYETHGAPKNELTIEVNGTLISVKYEHSNETGLKLLDKKDLTEELKATIEEGNLDVLKHGIIDQLNILEVLIPQLLESIGIVWGDAEIPEILFAPKANEVDGTKKDEQDIESSIEIPEILKDRRQRDLYSKLKQPTPEADFDMVGGLPEEVERMKLAVQRAMEPERYRAVGIEPKSTVMLVGPPGCGKTMLAEAAAKSVDGLFLSVHLSEIGSMWAGETEQNIAAIFDMILLLAKEQRVVLFLDEVESLAPSRSGAMMMEFERKHTAEFLNALNRFYPNCVIVAATNDPAHMDPAMLRSGRFNDVIEIGPPNADGRRQILSNWFGYFNDKAEKAVENQLDYDAIADVTEGFSGADMKAVAERALLDIAENKDYDRGILRPLTNERVIQLIAKLEAELAMRQQSYL